MRTIKKNILASLATLLAVILITTGFSMEIHASDTLSNVSENAEEATTITPIENEITDELFLKMDENVPYPGEVANYIIEDYEISRYEDFITIQKNDSGYTLFLNGEHFILVKDNNLSLWYVNEKRSIAVLEIDEYYFATDSDNYREISDFSLYESSPAYHVLGNADIPVYYAQNLITANLSWKWLNDNLEYVEKGNVLILTNHRTTATIYNDTMYVYRFGELKSFYEFPFEFKEIRKASNEIDMYNFVSSTNAVGTIRIWEVGDPTYRLVLGESENERHLFTPTEENHVTRFESSPDWIIFYDEGNLKAGKVCEPEMTFSFDNLPYEYRWIGDSCGVGKGTSEVSFLAETDYYDDSEITEELINQLVEETGINY